ncbi:hypothetical protein CC1G_08858 [Coprinopsis cinerea okayama7|uniref:F-box domain-containing protein n=1 Tax=Coprinopsis cinerea (strain Okayama-7 / 130 / ATCC MYA-4618 / FGSC 9003) TaxID=240176 RepID=A8P6D1_COPC7|nr:hypothetical protein CC1G_08858 [Coprinopsis cinerea okayama7\|eukprot:XP_001839132.2 hypothetical protein CC1G_08858 [Coprinopsis cinerea okayama7\
MTAPTKASEGGSSAIARLDAQILALESEVIRLKQERNEMLKVSQLPIETLCQIFLLVPEKTSAGHQRLGWVRITHVCRRWRTAALGCPLLWSALSSLYPPEWLDVMGARSTTAPLSIHFDRLPMVTQAERITQSKLRKVLKQTDRLQHISLTADPLCLQTMLKPLVAPLPLLETATITSIDPYEHSDVLADDMRMWMLTSTTCYLTAYLAGTLRSYEPSRSSDASRGYGDQPCHTFQT